MTALRRLPHRPRARVLPILALFFAVGAALRLASGVSEAVAQGTAAPPAASGTHQSAPVAATAPTQQTDPTDAAEILIDMRRRELTLTERETALREREALVVAAQDRLQAQIDALQSAEQELSATMALADQASEEDITRLVNVFEAMGAEQAAAVFSEMAPEFAAGFLGRLSPGKAAAILAGLDPRQAYGLSAILAGRNALVPHN